MESMRPFLDAVLQAALDSSLTPDAEQMDQREVRWWCGLWLARRRLRKGFTPTMVARRIGIDAYHLSLLEAGLLNPDGIAHEIWYRLCLILEEKEDLDLVASVVYNALGYPDAEQDHVVVAVVSELVPQIARDVDSLDTLYQSAEKTGLRPEVFRILEALSTKSQTARSISQAIAAQKLTTNIGLLTVHGTLRQLLQAGVVRQQLPSLSEPNQSEEVYALTARGQELVQTALERQALAIQQRVLHNEVQQVQSRLEHRAQELQNEEQQVQSRLEHLAAPLSWALSPT